MSYPESLRKIFEEISNDKTSGSTTLAVKSLEALKIFAQHEKGDTEQLLSFARELAFLRPTFVALTNLVSKAVSLYLSGSSSLFDAAEKLQKDVIDAKAAIAREFSKMLRRKVSILTISNSGSVSKAIKDSSDKVSVVFVCESRPGGEGEIFAEELNSSGIKCYLVPDLSIGSVIKQVDCIVMGADAIYEDGSIVNKLGSSALTKIAFIDAKKIYVLAETFKISPQGYRPRLEFYDEEKGIPIFDVTPLKYSQIIIGEKGRLKRRDIMSLAQKNASYLATIQNS